MNRLLIITSAALLVALSSPFASAQDPCLPDITCPAPEPTPEDPSPAPDRCPTEWSDGNGVFVGMVSDQLFANPDPEYRRCSLNRHAEVGVRIIRQALLWKDIETRRDRYDWSYWDQYVGDVARHGIQLMPIIFDAPRWRQARRPRPDWGAMPPRPHAMARFAARLVRRYGPAGSFWVEHADQTPVPIRVWQIWNEPNLPRYWAKAPSPVEYTRLLQTVNEAIKEEDPGATVVAAGMPDSRLWHVIPLYAYITQMYRAGARGAFDALAVNAYAETPGRMIDHLGDVRKLVRHFHDRSKIWVTEMGWGTGGPRYRFRVSRAAQATLLGKALRQLRDNRFRLGLRGFIHYMWQDAKPYGDTPDFWGLHTGLLDLDGDEKPSFGVFRRLGRQLRWIR